MRLLSGLLMAALLFGLAAIAVLMWALADAEGFAHGADSVIAAAGSKW